MTTRDAEHLGRIVAAELARPAPEAAHALAAALLHTHGDALAAILFYGSCRRTGDTTGLLDLTVLHEGHLAFHRRVFPALFNALLPPNVSLVTARHGEATVRAKVAILSLRQFRRRMRARSIDTTIWARFCQPATLLHARESRIQAEVAAAIACGIGTAALWAVRLGPPSGTPARYWTGLFERTYGVELRPEPAGRPAAIVDHDPAWYAAILLPALEGLGVAIHEDHAGVLHHAIPGSRHHRAAWAARWAAGRVLNTARLVKATFTFDGGADYVAWKIQRHAGIALHLTGWQRRHPLLAAPSLLLQWRRLAAARRSVRREPTPPP